MIFKKHICLFLAFFLLFTNSGIAFNVHYCEDEIASISLSSIANIKNVEDDCCGGIEESPACCDDKLIQSQGEIDQLIFKSISFEFPLFLSVYGLEISAFKLKKHFKKNQTTTCSFSIKKPPLYLLYSQYTFYA